MHVDPAARDAAYELKARYFFHVDNHEWDRLRSLFTDDARFEGFTFGQDGPGHFVEGVAELLDGTRSVHQGSLPRFRQLSPDVLRARWSMQDYLTWSPGTKPFRGDTSADLSGFRGYGYYDEEYRRTPDGWRTSFMRLTRLRVDVLRGPEPDTVAGTLPPDLAWLD